MAGASPQAPRGASVALYTISLDHQGAQPMAGLDHGDRSTGHSTLFALPPPCMVRPEMSTADYLGSRERAAGATHFVAPTPPSTRSTSPVLDGRPVEISRGSEVSSAVNGRAVSPAFLS